jgi:hypothetical protein
MSDAREIADIRERLARIETRQEVHGEEIKKGFDALGSRFDGLDDRMRNVEVKSGVYGTVAGGVISVGIAYLSAKLKSGA